MQKTDPALIKIIKGDITALKVDAIVNAANSHLAHGGGLAGLLLQKGGLTIQQESDAWIAEHGTVATASTAVTEAGALPSRFIIHAVGPIMGSGEEQEKIYNATISALQRAKSMSLTSIALPALSTGIFGVPFEISAAGMLSAAIHFSEDAGTVQNIIFCLYDDSALEKFLTCYESLQKHDV